MPSPSPRATPGRPSRVERSKSPGPTEKRWCLAPPTGPASKPAARTSARDTSLYDDRSDALASNGYSSSAAIRSSTTIGGGYRSNENADLAAGSGRVLVLSPLGGRSRAPQCWGTQLAPPGDELTAR